VLSDLRFRVPVLLLLALVVHTTLLPSIRIAGVMPDLMLLVAVTAALEAGPSYGATVGFVSGMLADLVLPTPLGLSALVFTLTGYAVGLAKAGLIRDAWWFTMVVAFVASSSGVGIFALAGWMIGEEGLVNGHLPTIMLMVGIFNSVMAPVVLRVTRWSLAGRERIRAYAG